MKRGEKKYIYINRLKFIFAVFRFTFWVIIKIEKFNSIDVRSAVCILFAHFDNKNINFYVSLVYIPKNYIFEIRQPKDEI